MEEIKMGKLTVTEADLEFTTTIGKDKFTVKIPLPSQKATIIAQISRALGGQNVDSFLANEYDYVKMLVTLNNVIVDNPTWWKGADVCPDEDLLEKLWKFYLNSEIEFQEFLKKNNNKESTE